jgi:hypothetical protein
MQIRKMPRRLLGALVAAPILAVGLAVGPLASTVGSAAPAAPKNAINSAAVAYISGANTGTLGSGADNYFTNTSQTCAPASAPTCTFAATGGSVSFSDRTLATLNTVPGTLAGFDTVFIYEVCDLSAAGNATALGKINTFLGAGNKVIVFDADGCTTSDYSAFGPTSSLAFATNNPGAQGANSQYTFVEPDDLTKASNGQAALVAGFSPQGDSLGDANVFTTSNGNWCGADSTINANGANGWVAAYSKPGVVANGGLAVYIGEDVRFTGSSLPAHNGQTVGNALSVTNPGGSLPCLHNASVAPPNSLLPSPSPSPVPTLPRSGSTPNTPVPAPALWAALALLVSAALITWLKVRPRPD